MALPATQSLSTWHVTKDEYFAGLGYEPHKGQKPVHDSDALFRVIVAGRRWGKSKLAAKEGGAELINPGTLGAIVSDTHDHTKLVFNEILKDMLGTAGLNKQKKTLRTSPPLYLEFGYESIGAENSSVMGFSADNSDSARGYQFDWIVFDEASLCAMSVWEQVLDATLHDRDGWILFITTPQGYNWIYDLFMDGQNPDEPDWFSSQSPTWDNPYHNKKRVEIARHNLTPAVFRQEYGAQFTIMAGQVYPKFNQRVHVIPHEELKIPKEWPRWTSIDWGYEDPFVRLYIATDEQDRPIIYDEYYVNHLEPEKLIKKLSKKVSRRKEDKWGKRYMEDGWGNKYVPKQDTDTTVYKVNTCDPSRPESRATFASGGIRCTPVRTPVLEDGLDDVRKFITRPDETPGMFVSSKCVQTIKEFNLYKYPKREDGKASGNPIDAYNHCYDGQTELLTDKGWLLFKHLDQTELVATMNTDQVLEWHKPTEYQAYEVQGNDLLTYDGQMLDFAVTPDHLMLHYNMFDVKKKGKRRLFWSPINEIESAAVSPKKTARTGKTASLCYIPTICKPEKVGKECGKVDPYFLGFFIAEGCKSISNGQKYVYIYQKDKKILMDAMARVAPHVNPQKANSCWRTGVKDADLYDLLPHGRSYEKSIPRWFLESASQDELVECFNGLMAGDGCWQKREHHYDTTSYRLASDFQELLVRIGLDGYLSQIEDWRIGRTPNKSAAFLRPVYRINIHRSNGYIELHGKRLRRIKYFGMVYDVTVKNNSLCLRRNGRVMWGSNCLDAFRYWAQFKRKGYIKQYGPGKGVMLG